MDWSDSDSELITIYEFDIEHGVGQPLGSIPKLNYDGTAFSPDSSLFASATLEGVVHVYDTGTWTRKHSAPLYDRACGRICDKDGFRLQQLFAGRFLWRRQEYCQFGTLNPHEIVFSADNGVGPPKFTANGAFLVSGRPFSGVPDRFDILVWNQDSGSRIGKISGRESNLHPNSELMATIGPDSRVWIWNIKQDQLLVILPVPQP